MKLSIGIVGLPNVGKSTLFKILTKIPVNIANYPFCTIDPNVGVVAVPDERLDKLAAMSRSAKIVPAAVEFYDIAGLVKNAHKGEGLGNQFLSHIRDTHAIIEVLRCFKGGDIVHVEQSVDPLRDKETINTELMLKDLEMAERRLPRAHADAKGGNKDAVREVEALLGLVALLRGGKSVSRYFAEHEASFKNVPLLSAKKKLYLLNGVASDAPDELKAKIAEEGSGWVAADLAAVETIPEVIKKAYELLGLISFFTTGEDETRAWTITRGMRAPQAAGVIHTDFEKNFIRAEVIGWRQLLEAGSWNAAKQKGWLRLEGKEYEVQEGDVIVVRHG